MIQGSEMKRGKDIGRGKLNYNFYIEQACSRCGKVRWVKLNAGNPINDMCFVCSIKSRRRERNPAWKGGRNYGGGGYIDILLEPDDFFYSMVDKRGYVREHRLIMAQYLNRCLLPWEIVHHKNGVRDDNRLENLALLPSAYKHDAMTKLATYIKRLEGQIEKLQLENIKLQQGKH